MSKAASSEQEPTPRREPRETPSRRTSVRRAIGEVARWLLVDSAREWVTVHAPPLFTALSDFIQEVIHGLW